MATTPRPLRPFTSDELGLLRGAVQHESKNPHHYWTGTGLLRAYFPDPGMRHVDRRKQITNALRVLKSRGLIERYPGDSNYLLTDAGRAAAKAHA